MNQIINMILRLFMRKAINSGINSGIKAVSNRRRKKPAPAPQAVDDFGNVAPHAQVRTQSPEQLEAQKNKAEVRKRRQARRARKVAREDSKDS